MDDKPQKKTPNKHFVERRRGKFSQDPLVRLVTVFNIAAWLALMIALFTLHYARPDYVTGVQKYWQLEGRVHWSAEHLSWVLQALQVCLGFTLISLYLRSKRTRRKRDYYGINLLVLLVLALFSMITIYVVAYD